MHKHDTIGRCHCGPVVSFQVALLLILLVPRSGWGQSAPDESAESKSLGELLEVAIRQEPGLARATVDIEVADAQILREAGVDDWRLKAAGSVLLTRLQPFNVDYDEVKVQADVGRALPTGGSLSLHAESGYMGTSLPFPGADETYQSIVSATLAQPLLKGRGQVIPRARQEKARVARDIAQLKRERLANQMALNVVQAYWDLAYAYRALEISQRSQELAQKLLEYTQAGVEGGRLEASDLLAVQQSIAMREAEVSRAEIAISRASLRLRKIAGLDIGPRDIDIRISAPLARKTRQLGTEELLEAAFANSAELALLAEQQRGADIEVRIAEHNELPALDVSLTLGTIGASDSPGDAIVNMVTFDDLLVGAQVTLEHDLGGRTAQGTTLQAHARSRQAELAQTEAKTRLAQAVIEAVKQAELAQREIELSERVIELAEKNVEASRARFELGRSTNFEVLQRQEELRQLELRQARAIASYLKAVAAVDALTGALLSKYGVHLEPRAAQR